MTSRKLGNRRFLKPGCDQLFRAARNDNQACKRGARRAGEVYTVRYDAVNAMLLNEFLKEHKAFVEEHSNVEKLQVTVAQQQKQIEAHHCYEIRPRKDKRGVDLISDASLGV